MPYKYTREELQRQDRLIAKLDRQLRLWRIKKRLTALENSLRSKEEKRKL